MTSGDDREALAAEYAMGTLDADERARAGALIESDPEFSARVSAWERRLGELHAMVDPIEPPDDIWPRIATQIATAGPCGELRLPEIPQPKPTVPVPAVWSDAPVLVDLSRQVGVWRRFAIASGALAVVLALLAVAALTGILPVRGPSQTQSVGMPAQGLLVAALQRDATPPAFILAVDLAHASFTVRRMVDLQPDRSYELWLISDKFPKPRSLGLVDREFTSGGSLSGYDAATIRGATFLVTLEPQGGSPTGDLSGIVVSRGTLVEAAPPPAPAGSH